MSAVAGLGRLELPSSGAKAAGVCLAARLPVSEPAQLRMTARRSSAIGAALRDAGSQLTSAADAAIWSGAAAEAFRSRLRASAPNIAATADRYDSYASALLGYAAAVEQAAPTLRMLAAQLSEELARSVDPPSGLAPPLAASGPIIAAPTLATPEQALVLARQAEARDQALLVLARRFAASYNQWVDAVAGCMARIRQANSADPTHDLHGWVAWEHRLSAVAHYVDPVLSLVRDPSWRNASNALSWLSSNLTFVALAAMIVCPGVAAVCLTVAVALSAAQLAVDSWRKWGNGEQVSAMSLIMDGLGAVPFGGLAAGGRAAAPAVKAAWRAGAGVAKVRDAAAAAAPTIRRLGSQAVHNPTELVAPGYRDLPVNYFRSTEHGGAAALARRWRAPLLWDGPNAVLGLPQVSGSSTPQVLWDKREDVKSKASQIVAPIGGAVDDLAAGVSRAARQPE